MLHPWSWKGRDNFWKYNRKVNSERGGGGELPLKSLTSKIIHHTSISQSMHINWNTKLNIYIHSMKVKYSTNVWHKIFGYPKTLQREGKIGVGMTPTNHHYYSNKVYPIKVIMFHHETWPTLWKFYLVKGLQRLLGLNLLKDFNTLL